MGLLDRMDKKIPGVQPGASVIELDEAAALRDRVHYQVVETLNKRDEKHSSTDDYEELFFALTAFFRFSFLFFLGHSMFLDGDAIL